MEAQVKRIVTITVGAALALSACAIPARSSGMTTQLGSDPTTTVVKASNPPVARGVLLPFDACDDLLDWTIGHALDRVGPYGLESYGAYPVFDEVFADAAGALEQSTAPRSPTTTVLAGDGEVLGTNLQEVGVDEPDLVKADGNHIVAVSGSTLYVVSIDRDRLKLRGSIDLGFWTQDLFLDGNRVIAIANGGYDVMPFAEDAIDGELGVAAMPTPVVSVVEVDISDSDDPDLSRTLRIDGRYISSRMVDGAIRLVVSAGYNGLAWVYPEGGGLRAEREAEARNREIIENSTVENWLPYFVVTDHRGRDRVIDEGTLLACDRTNYPDEFSGFNTLSLITLDSSELGVVDATGVFADGDIVYSSGNATYVATSRWVDPVVFELGERPAGTSTMIHKFALSDRSADYRASGAVPGYMLSQWSMSEHDGYLRVASTDTPQWWDGPESESMVTVLTTTGDELRAVGGVDGLGRGERIYSVRFFGDLGYVVTFRQVDPLYVIDLSNPERPKVRGELKIPGYSAYLHPVGDDALLGVGQDADLDGRVLGLQTSLFDVSDPDDPVRVDRYTMENGHSEVEWDHHAFLHDPLTGLTVFPYERWDDGKTGRSPTGALVLSVTEDGIRETGVVSHDPDGSKWWMPIRRSLLIDGNLVTVSEAGVMVSDADTLTTIDWIEFER
jgi:hypothetical protein